MYRSRIRLVCLENGGSWVLFGFVFCLKCVIQRSCFLIKLYSVVEWIWSTDGNIMTGENRSACRNPTPLGISLVSCVLVLNSTLYCEGVWRSGGIATQLINFIFNPNKCITLSFIDFLPLHMFRHTLCHPQGVRWEFTIFNTPNCFSLTLTIIVSHQH
jgi:hypothetical protein